MDSLAAAAPLVANSPSAPVGAALVPRRRGGRRWLLAASAAGLVVVAAGATIEVRRHAASTTATGAYETVRVDRGRILARVTATGTVSALLTVQVGSQVSGRIQALHADFNSQVRKGQLIAKIDPRLYAAASEQTRATVSAIQGQLHAARATLAHDERLEQRSREVRAQKLIAEQDLDTARSATQVARGQLAALEGQLKQARAALHQAEINVAYTDILSPIDGTVVSRNVDVGQTVAATLQAPTLFVIAQDLRKMQVDTSVAEADVGKLRAGMAATFTVDAYPGEQFRGRVRQVRNNPQTVQNVVTYDAVIDVDNPDLELKPGMTANVTFVHGDVADALRAPNVALRFRAPDAWTSGRARPPEGGGERLVWALRAGRPTPVLVRTGMSDGTMTQVTSGDLRAGEVLITDAGGKSAVPPAVRRLF